MHGPGERDKHGKDKDQDIAELLQNGSEEDVRRAIELIHRRHGRLIWRILRKQFPGLSPQELSDIYEDGLDALKSYALSGRFKRRTSGTGALALLKQIVIFDGIDVCRRVKRRDEVYRAYYFRRKRIRLDDPHKLSDLLMDVNEYIDKELAGLERTTLKIYVRLLCRRNGTRNGQSPESLLPRRVNKVKKKIGQPTLSDEEILASLGSAMRKLRNHLENWDSSDE
jgi:hypothetical protein